MENIYPQYVTKEAVEGLVRKINLPMPGRYSQDWEYEVSDSSRVAEFLSFYENIALNKEEKFALMIIIISSYNDAIVEEKTEESIAERIKYLLLNDADIHKNTIFYWALLDEDDLEDCFAITSFMREVASLYDKNQT